MSVAVVFARSGRPVLAIDLDQTSRAAQRTDRRVRTRRSVQGLLAGSHPVMTRMAPLAGGSAAPPAEGIREHRRPRPGERR